ncbi:hypothetical protein [Streptomyces sp. NPDC056480]|uniref:hypothetical protein n=1 Tax=Streptomyces sp. NPDC056480 TaxID=3345833 RepID=UPI0036B45362
MKRLHLFEFQDLPWLPRRIRDLATDVLRDGVVLRWDVYRPVVPILADLMRRTGTTTVVDLCSGGTGPWLNLKDHLEKEYGPFILHFTDKYPNHEAFSMAREKITDGRVRYDTVPVDATDVPDRLEGIRTMFTSFHHFEPDEATAILKDAYEKNDPICVFECTRRNLSATLGATLAAPLVAWSARWHARPVRVLETIVTYVIPIIPVILAWDAFVSNLRTYTPRELRQMTAGLHSDNYSWEIGYIQVGALDSITYAIGSPVKHA